MRRCQNCGRPADEEASICEYCDEPLGTGQNTQKASQSQRGQEQSSNKARQDNQPNKGDKRSRQQGRQKDKPPKGQSQSPQPSGGQGQGGQPPGQPPGRPESQHSGGDNESPIQAIQRSGPMRFIKGSAVLGAVNGFIFAIMMFLIGKVGGFPILPSGTDTARAGFITQSRDPNAANAFDAGVETAHETIIAYMSTELAPFVAFGLAIVVGVLVTTRLNETIKTKLATAGAGMAAGGFLLVVVSSFVIGLFGPDLPSALLQGTELRGVNTDLSSLQVTNIVFNGLFAGLGSGATAAATVFSLDSFMLDQ